MDVKMNYNYYNLKLISFKTLSRIDILRIICETAVRWMPQHLQMILQEQVGPVILNFHELCSLSAQVC